jgi:hypothetical protein
MYMRTRLLFPLLTTAACLAIVVPASAATSEAVSENWAGYEATPDSSSSDFSAVSGAWTQPVVNCTSGSTSYSAYWVGLGGGSESSDALEQVGTQADCSSSGKASYYAWYELVPKAPVSLKLAIKPGDQISARTAVSGTAVTVTLTDSTSGQSVTKTLKMSDPDTTSAEWVAEAPSECQGSAASDCTPLALADFDKVKFTNALATAGGHTGSVSDSDWTSEKIALEPESDSFSGGGYGGYGAGGPGGYSTYGEAASVDSSGGASPSSLTDGGQSFTVSYSSTSSSSSSSGTGTGSTYPSTSSGSGAGDGYGYGAGGSSSYGYGYGAGGYGDSYGYGGDGYGDSYGYGGDGYGDSYGYGSDGYVYVYPDGYGESYGDTYGDAYGDAYSDETYSGAFSTVYGSGWVF